MSTQQQFSLTGRIALITGGGSGFGAHFATVLSAAGAKVAVVARRLDRIEAVAKSIEDRGGSAIACAMDVRDRGSIDRAFEQIQSKLGVVDILVNNAGQSNPAPFTDMSEEQWTSVMDTNVGGAYRTSQEMSRRLIAAKRPGSIINIASITGLQAKAMFVNYGSSKAALIHLTKSMAMELLPYGIRVNAMAPGYFPTELTQWYFDTDAGKAEIQSLPSKRLGRLDELDGALLLLASEASSYINATVINIDYGHAARLS